MALKALQKLRKIEIQQKITTECDCLVIGENFFAINFFNQYKNKNPAKVISLLATREISFDNLYCQYPSDVRGSDNIDLFLDLYRTSNPEVKEAQVSFYKEGRFRPFGGRSKSEALLWDEEFYTFKSVDFSVDKICDLSVVENYYNVMLSKIRFISEDNSWQVIGSNGSTFNVKKLVWALPLYRFFDLLEDKNLADLSVLEFVEQSKTPSLLQISYTLGKQLVDQFDTVFLPLSYTHEQGHFIGQFFEKDGKQYGNFFNYIDAEQSGEEEISKRIRQLRKNLDKIFPMFERNIIEEKITVVPHAANAKIVDQVSNFYSKLPKSLAFIGENAPLEFSSSLEDKKFQITHFARGLVSSQQRLKIISGDI